MALVQAYNSIRTVGEPSARIVLLHLADERDLAETDTLYACIRAETEVPFFLAGYGVSDWNRDLSPWKSPPVYGSESFCGGADKTLALLQTKVLPALSCGGRSVLLLGYSLAGLFALWTAYHTDALFGVAAVSPSLWFPGWTDFASAHDPLVRRIYLSLGEREAHTRHPILSAVGDAVRMQKDLLLRAGVETQLDWNPGNHFTDPMQRTAKGALWLLQQYERSRTDK